MSDDDLHRLSLDVGNLVPKAREALRAEMERRHFPMGGIDWSVIATLLSLVKGVDMEKLGEGMAQFVLYNTLALTVITAKIIVPRKRKTVWIIGIVEPVCAFLLLGVVGLVR